MKDRNIKHLKKYEEMKKKERCVSENMARRRRVAFRARGKIYACEMVRKHPDKKVHTIYESKQFLCVVEGCRCWNCGHHRANKHISKHNVQKEKVIVR